MKPSRKEDRNQWGSILASNSLRSRSLSPRARRQRKAQSQSPPSRHHQPRIVDLIPPEPTATTMGSLVKSWIMTPTSQKPSSKLVLPKTPILTLLLIRLEESIPLYCQKLAVPTMKNAASAAAFLDNTIATASSSPSSSAASPASPSSQVAGSALALQSCWETYISPFFLLAAAEALYTQERSLKLIALYVKVANDLTVVQQTLCDPFLENPSGFHHGTATSLTQYLVGLREWTSMRCQLLELVASFSMEQLPGFQTLWHDVSLRAKEHTDEMTVALQTEVQLWLWLTEACWNLQQCRFMETILTVRRVKVKLESIQERTKLHDWFVLALQEIHSILPLYFDRLRAHASPVYGFEPARLGTPSANVDFDGQITDFLRKYEGTMAVCIVLEDPDDETCPAMYLRSSIDILTRSNSSGGSLSSRLLLGGRREEDVEDVSNVEQYSNSQSWPHTEWKDLVTILRNEVNPEDLGPAMTFRAKEVESASPPNSAPGFLARAPAAPASYFHVVALSSSTCLWLVAIVKGDDASTESTKWNLRMPRGGNHHTEEDVRAFLDDMASKLRVSNLVENTTFEQQAEEAVSNSVTNTSRKDVSKSVATKAKKALSVGSLVLEWNEANTQSTLRTIKHEFGLRPQSPMTKPLKSPYQLAFGSVKAQRKRIRGRKRREKPVDESAAAWFLGPELLKLAKEGKLKQGTPSRRTPR